LAKATKNKSVSFAKRDVEGGYGPKYVGRRGFWGSGLGWVHRRRKGVQGMCPCPISFLPLFFDIKEKWKR
jgi:hypothetical protein